MGEFVEMGRVRVTPADDVLFQIPIQVSVGGVGVADPVDLIRTVVVVDAAGLPADAWNAREIEFLVTTVYPVIENDRIGGIQVDDVIAFHPHTGGAVGGMIQL